MFVELQVDTGVFVGGLRLLLNRDALAINTELLYKGKASIVDRVDLVSLTDPEATVVSAVPAPFPVGISVVGVVAPVTIPGATSIRIRQGMQLSIASIEDLQNSGSQSPSVEKLDVVVRFDLRFGEVSVGSAPRLWFQYAGLDLVDLGGVLDAAAVAKLDSDFYFLFSLQNSGRHSISDGWFLDLSALGTISELASTGGLTLSNSGACIHESEKFVALRVEVNGPYVHLDSVPGWIDFYQGKMPSHLHGSDWGIFIHRDLFMEPLRERLQAELDLAAAEDQFLASPSSPVLTWLPDKPGLRAEVSGEIPDFCPLIVLGLVVGTIDLDVDMTMDMVFSMPMDELGMPVGDQLDINLKIEADTDTAEVFGCAVPAGFLWPIVGSWFTEPKPAGTEPSDPQKIGLLEHVGLTLLGPLGAGIAFMVAAGDAAPNVPLPAFEAVEDTDADAEYHLSQDLDLAGVDPFLGLITTLTQVQGSADGLDIHGTTIFPATSVASAMMQIPPDDDRQLAWGWSDPCGSAQLTAEVILPIENTGAGTPRHTPLKLTDVRIVDDDVSQFTPYLNNGFPGQDHGYVSLSIPFPALLTQYLAAQYDCKVLIMTNGGCRVITIPPPPELSSVEYQNFQTELIFIEATQCKTWAPILWGKVFNPLWHVDPQPHEGVIQRFSIVSVARTKPGARIEVRNDTGDLVVQARVAQSGYAQLAIPETVPRLSISVSAPESEQLRADARSSAEPRIQGRLAVGQRLLIQEAVLEIGHPIRALTAGRRGKRHVLFGASSAGLHAYEVDRAGGVHLLARTSERGLRGAQSWDRGLISWGERGASYRAWNGAPETTLIEHPVRSAVVHAGHFYLLTEHGLSVFDRRLAKTADVAAPGHESVVRVGRVLVLGGSDKLSTVDVRDPACPGELEDYTSPGPRRVGAAGLVPSSARLVLAETGCGGCTTVGFGEPRRLDEVVTYARLPWFAGAVRLGTRIAHVTRDLRSIVIQRVTPEVALTESQIDPPK